MSEIPKDILNRAAEVYSGLNANCYSADCDNRERASDVEAIAYVILSERLRCATIADGSGIRSPKFMNDSNASMGRWIAKMIREHPNP